VSRGATARLFVAVDPPQEVCGRLAAWARAALGELHADAAAAGESPAPAQVRLLRPETMHVTLCFLGGRPIDQIDAIAAALSACAAPDLRLHVGAPLWLPPRRPRALALEVGDRAGELARLAARVGDVLAATIDHQPERRRFRGHVTVARIGHGGDRARRSRANRRRDGGAGRDAPPATGGSPLAPTPQLSFDVHELVLYRSLLSREGASYEALARSDLRAADASSPAWPSSSSASGVSGADSGATGQSSAGSSSSSSDDDPCSSHSRSEPPSQE
jgi:2'-5' RNA ligase